MRFPGKNPGVGCRLLRQGIFLTQGSNSRLLHLLHWQVKAEDPWNGCVISTLQGQKRLRGNRKPEASPYSPGSGNCQGIRQAFTSAFISKDPCKAAKDDYKPLLDLAHPTVPCDKAVFWSKTRELAHEYAKRRGLLTLEDTLLGSLADGLSWCGEPGSPGETRGKKINDFRIWDCPSFLISSFLREGKTLESSLDCKEIQPVRSLRPRAAEGTIVAPNKMYVHNIFASLGDDSNLSFDSTVFTYIFFLPRS
ncbi:hypothetical protein FD755_023110 [Muntiacus reevesi]|uniref:ADP-ribosyl cyclase/cyclic ADP-ribose hydrolase 1 n=1 Tax=Muntiacus reevesi TaxID=9886 RepID=A0A5N3W1Q7_MUNRE|nr:hypothetical protein FD755_023110 [Muntiacus reevesi]